MLFAHGRGGLGGCCQNEGVGLLLLTKGKRGMWTVEGGGDDEVRILHTALLEVIICTGIWYFKEISTNANVFFLSLSHKTSSF